MCAYVSCSFKCGYFLQLSRTSLIHLCQYVKLFLRTTVAVPAMSLLLLMYLINTGNSSLRISIHINQQGRHIEVTKKKLWDSIKLLKNKQTGCVDRTIVCHACITYHTNLTWSKRGERYKRAI